MKMDDDGEQDDKVVAVPSEDPRWDHVEDLEDITQQQLDEIEEFFETCKNLEADKEVETRAGRTDGPPTSHRARSGSPRRTLWISRTVDSTTEGNTPSTG